MLALEIEWLDPVYEAGLAGAHNEWPPHPARAFCALVAAADAEGADDDALRWLEDQPPPKVVHSEGTSSVLRAYVPTNSTGGGKADTSQQYVGRTNGERVWPRTLLQRPIARLVWSDANPPPGVSERLSQLAPRVPYLGRAASPALLSFRDSLPEPEPDLVAIEPAAHGAQIVRVPYPGYLSALRTAFDRDQRSWTVSRSIAYALAGSEREPPPPAVTAYHDIVVLGLPSSPPIDGRHAMAVARAWKAAVLQRLGRPAEGDPWDAIDADRLALVHGHHDGTRRQAAFLTLPFVGHRHADGHLIGLAVALSPDLDPEVRRSLLRLFGLDRDEGPRLMTLRVPGLPTTFPLRTPDGRKSLLPETWQGPARTWATVFPLVPDRWPKRSYPASEVVADGCEMAGYPRPSAVRLAKWSTVPGAPWMPPAGTRRRSGTSSPAAIHAVIRFPVDVKGPVVVGHLRHLGLGLCIPTEWSGA